MISDLSLSSPCHSLEGTVVYLDQISATGSSTNPVVADHWLKNPTILKVNTTMMMTYGTARCSVHYTNFKYILYIFSNLLLETLHAKRQLVK